MRKSILAVAVFMAASSGHGAEPGIVRPFENYGRIVSTSPIDALVLSKLHDQSIEPASLCSDEVFLRRVYLDVIGTLPKPQEVRKFLRDSRPDKRATLIDALLERDEFADYWALKWCDLLRVKAEFPINLWPNAVQAYHRWIRDSVRENKPYDQFVRELLTSSGSNFRVPPVNFYRAIQGQEPSVIAGAVALTFMGTRIERWPEARRLGMEAFFSRVAYKPTAEWKEEIVYLDPAPADALETVFPDGTAVRILPENDPREVFADWLVAADNPWFARNVVNRLWSWLLGRGIIHEPDDIRPDNPAANPELLVYLEKELVSADYDLRHMYRLILKSRTYQPARDTGLESERNNQPTDTQRLHLLNSTHIQRMIERSRWLHTLLRSYKGNYRFVIRAVYVRILSRHPTRTELAEVENYVRASGLDRRQAANDLAWALINTKEFLYRH